MSILYRRHVLLQGLAGGPGERVRRRAVTVVHQVRGDHFVQNHSPVALVVWQGEVIDGSFGRGSQLLQHVFDVKLERLLAKVSVHYLARRLQSHCGI